MSSKSSALRLHHRTKTWSGEPELRRPQPDFIGDSPGSREVHEQIEQVARSNATVLLRGETGVGKELVARAIHDRSHRSGAPLVTVNCAALPDNLIESELYGHERGAFTGADNRKRGRFELAHGGTLFLDEIGELSLTAQMKLLRVLQERTLERLGGETSVNVDVRIIAATHKDLESAIAARTFREDLYYRIDVFTIFIPPLRDRRTEIPQLANYFMSRFAAEHGKDATEISSEAMSLLAGYSWPGNVRELQNAIERAVLISKDRVIRRGDLPSLLRSVKSNDAVLSLCDASSEFEKQMIEEALRASGGCKAKSARLLGTTERVVSYKIRKYSIDCGYFRG